jgi:hypothetical protein
MPDGQFPLHTAESAGARLTHDHTPRDHIHSTTAD